jgi:hypothetical protein
VSILIRSVVSLWEHSTVTPAEPVSLQYTVIALVVMSTVSRYDKVISLFYFLIRQDACSEGQTFPQPSLTIGCTRMFANTLPPYHPSAVLHVHTALAHSHTVICS